jgi:hypothetical protein
MSNLFTRFLKLLPQAPLRVGDVVAVDNGVATIEEPGGAQSTARGDVTLGDRVFFRDGAIEGPAPNLTLVEIDV